jgi:hypothetical protein
MVVEENCQPGAMDKPLARSSYVVEEVQHTYRKVLNLRPMRDGGIMSASKCVFRTNLTTDSD